jgi:hypothetical protein
VTGSIHEKFEVLSGLEQTIYVNECCHCLIRSAIWIGMDVAGNFHDQFEVIFFD